MKIAIRTAILIACAALLTWAVQRPVSTQSESVIRIKAKRFEFTPDHITLKKGMTTKLELTSDDVTHGFFVRPLKIDAEIQPGKTTEVEVTPQAAGTYTIICDHFCGVNHGAMHMTIEVVE